MSDDSWIATADQRPWAAEPGQPVCPQVYGGEFWSPRPCIQAAGHDGFHADAYGRTWSER